MIRIRAYQNGDEQELWSLFFETMDSNSGKNKRPLQVEPWNVELFHPERWQQTVAQVKPYVATLDGQIVGFADLNPDGSIEHFFCLQIGDNGIAKRLLRRLLGVAQHRNINCLHMRVSQHAKEFFEGQGFYLVQTSPVCFDKDIEDSFAMERKL
jgi:putative acetyltransferase